MHFGKQLRLLAYQPWRKQYLDFVLLKKSLKAVVTQLRAEGRTIRVLKSRDVPAPSLSPLPSSQHPHQIGSPSGRQLLNQSGSGAVGSRPQTPAVLEEKEEDNEEEALAGGIVLVSIGEVAKHIEDGEGSEDDEDGKEKDEFEEQVLLTPETEAQFLAVLRGERDRVGEFFKSKVEEYEAEIEDICKAVRDRKARRQVLTPLKKRFFDILIMCEELLDYARLNLVGFTKIVKKFCRHTDFAGRAEVMADIGQHAAFVTMVPAVEALRNKVKAKYCDAFREPKLADSKLLQEMDQSVVAARSWKKNTILFEVDEHMRKATVRVQKKQIKFIPVILALVVIIIFMWAPIFPERQQAAQRCLAILAGATILWVSECWPLFVTSILVSLLTVMSYVILDANGSAMGPVAASKEVFKRLYPTSVPLMLAGFSISEAFKKYKIDMMLAHKLLGSSLFKTPQRFLIAVELLCFFMSMWISNVAASVLTLTVVMPIIRDLPDRCKYIKSLLMAIAVAGNVGGMTTQIASPQNAVTVALGDYSIDFIKFIAVALPVCPFLLISGHILVVTLYKPDIDHLPEMDDAQRAAIEAASSSSGSAAAALEAAMKESSMHEEKSKSLRAKVPFKVISVIAITVISIALWIASNWLTPFGCNIGTISLFPLVLFFGTGLLAKEDFERLPWALTMLLAGGNVLGYAVDSSQLLSMVAGVLEKLPANTFVLAIVANIIMMIAGSFISHTVAALILLGLSAKVGVITGHPKLLVMTSVIMCSGAMPLPISSFPNLNAVSLEDADGQPYVTTADFLKLGIAQTLIAFVGSCSITYGMSLALGF